MHLDFSVLSPADLDAVTGANSALDNTAKLAHAAWAVFMGSVWGGYGGYVVASVSKNPRVRAVGTAVGAVGGALDAVYLEHKNWNNPEDAGAK